MRERERDREGIGFEYHMSCSTVVKQEGLLPKKKKVKRGPHNTAFCSVNLESLELSEYVNVNVGVT